MNMKNKKNIVKFFLFFYIYNLKILNDVIIDLVKS